MRIWLFTLALLLSAVTSTAQTISRRYDGVSMSQALADIDKSTEQYKVNFIYDELDDFPVNCHFNQINVLDAIMAVIGHYPVKVTIQGQYVFVECVEKRQTKVRGRVLGARSAPLPNANITIYDARTGEKVCSGVSNEGGEFSIPCDSMRIRFKVSHVGYRTFFKTCQAGMVGTIQLQFTKQELQNVEVTPTTQRNHTNSNSSYKKKAERIRKQIWDDSDSAFSQTCLDDSLLNYSSVTLAESFSGEYERHHSWNPLHLFFGNNTNHTISRQVVRRRVMLNDSDAVERYALLDYPKDLPFKYNKDLTVVMGVRVVSPDGSIYEVDTDPYTQPLQYDGEQRPDKISIPQLFEGCIIDYFTWSERKTYGIHPSPFFIITADGEPVLHSRINLTTDKNLSVQYRHSGDSPGLSVSTEDNGSLCLTGQNSSVTHGSKNTTMSYIFYVRDPQLHANRPLSALKHQVRENPSMDDILDTTTRLYQSMRTKESYGGWASTYWNKTDTTIIGLKVDNLRQTSTSRPLLEQRLYEMVMSEPPHITLKKFGTSQSNSVMSLNRQYTEKLAYVFDRAGIPYHLAISTRSDREGILELMDEENIVWMLVTEEGRYYIPFIDEEMPTAMVGQKATTTDFNHIFTIR